MIDTQKIADRLRAAETEHRLAEAIASEILAAQTEGELVTVPVLKSSLAELELRITKEINTLREAVRNVWRPIVIVGLITWILQVFGSAIHSFLHLPS